MKDAVNMKDDKAPKLERSFQELDLAPRQRLAILFINYIPFVHVAATLCTAFIPWAHAGWRAVAALFVLFVPPPVLARCILLMRPIRNEHIPVGSADYFTWWTLLNLQTVFCRLPFLEEAMRFVPGLYSAWLRLWGSRIGAFTYWAAGLRVLDRGFLSIGDGVAFGAGVRLNPHVIAENDDGALELILAPVHIGDRALIGGYALLTAGTRIADDERTRARLLSPPFSHWENGRRTSKSHSTDDRHGEDET